MATGNITIDFANQIIEKIIGLVDAKSEEAGTWAQNTVTAASAQVGKVKSPAVIGASPPSKPTLPSKPTPPPAPEIAQVTDAPLLKTPLDLPPVPVAPTTPDLGNLSADSMVNEFKSIQADLREQLKNSLGEFSDRWFQAGPVLKNLEDNWLQRVLTGGSTIDALVESQLWERDRARLSREAVRATGDAFTLWAGRGYALPPGALAHQAAEISTNLMNALSQQSRDIAIKAHTDEIENAKFAIQQITSLRESFMATAVNFIHELVLGMGQAIQFTTGKADAIARIAGAKTALYSAETDAQTKLFGALAGAKTDVYKASTGAEADVYRATVAGYQAQTAADIDVYKAASSSEIEAFRALSGAAVSMFQAEVGASELGLRAKTSTAQLSVDVDKANQAAQIAQIQEKVKALAANAAQVAAQCAAAIQGLRAGATTSNQSSTQMTVMSQ